MPQTRKVGLPGKPQALGKVTLGSLVDYIGVESRSRAGLVGEENRRSVTRVLRVPRVRLLPRMPPSPWKGRFEVMQWALLERTLYRHLGFCKFIMARLFLGMLQAFERLFGDSSR
ncbi:hypothetical protein PIB30_075072 [Stylosanthes scabra]|uniref:Uncharacterized protein n=1 Tax=Stylosanthes scabra TaxID=79078 RepID=A0ABU6RPQ4_9FABA|nr:hypothetical protein [Stylosanthes scabra]